MERKTFIEFGKQKDNTIDYLIGILEDARVTTLRRVVNVTLEELHWQFKPGWNTIGVLLSHMIANEHFFRIMYLEGRELSKEESEQWTPGQEMGKYIPQLITHEPLDNYFIQLQQSRALLLQGISPLTKEDFWEKREGDYNLAWVLYHLAEDEVHHRGQISILRKLYALENKT